GKDPSGLGCQPTFRERVNACRLAELNNNYGNTLSKLIQFASPFSVLFTPEEAFWSYVESAVVKGGIMIAIPTALNAAGLLFEYEASLQASLGEELAISEAEFLEASEKAYAMAEAAPAVMEVAGTVGLGLGVFLTTQDAVTIARCDLKLLFQ